MGIDGEGRIKTVGEPPWQEAFCPVLEDVRRRLSPGSVPFIHSVHVYGSVAAAKAVPGRSDLDLCLILHHPPGEDERALLEHVRQQIEAAHPVVGKVDLDIGCVDDLSAPETGMAWRYWLRHHCRRLMGEDLAADIPLFRPSRALAHAVNGDFRQVLGTYLEQLEKAGSREESGRLIRAAARKLVRSTNILRHDADRDWPDSLEDHALRFSTAFPERQADMLYFLEQSRMANGDPAAFAGRMRGFIGWMADLAEHAASSGPEQKVSP